MSNLHKALCNFAFGFFLILFLSPLALGAQEEKASEDALPVYAIINYMKAKPGQEPAKMEREIYEPVHQESTNRGYRIGWDLIGVWMPNGTSRPYDYITVDYYRGMPGSQGITDEQQASAWNKIHPGINEEEVYKKTEAARDLVWSDLFVWKDGTAGPKAADARYYIIHKMKVRQKDMEAYEAMESNIAKPWHDVAIKNGNYQAWNFWKLVLPSGAGRDYNYLTGEAYVEIADMDKPGPEDGFKKAHPDKNEEKEFAKIFELREDASTEAWYLISRVRKEEASAKK